MSRDRRIIKELAEMEADRDSSGVVAVPVADNNLMLLKGTFPAPPDTPYEGGTYEVEIKIPDSYPFKSPVIRFITKIWHPNVSSQTGAICLDTLSSAWSPVQTIKTALLSLRMLLEFPNPKDPQDAEVAKMMINDPEGFARHAQAWAVKYAGAKPKDLDMSKYHYENKAQHSAEDYGGYNKEMIDQFVNMGFEPQAVVAAFRHEGIPRNNGLRYDLEEAYVGSITARLLGE